MAGDPNNSQPNSNSIFRTIFDRVWVAIRVGLMGWDGTQGRKVSVDSDGRVNVILASADGEQDTGNSTTATLGAAGVFTGTWKPTTGLVSASIVVEADQVSATDGIEIQYSRDAVSVHNSVKKTFTSDQVTAGSLFFTIGMRLAYYRIKYTNGGTPQGSFSIYSFIRPTVTELPQSNIESVIDESSDAVMTRAAIHAENDSGNYGNIKRGDNGGLRVSVNEHEVDTPIKALTGFATSGSSSIGTTAVQVGTALNGRKTISFKANPVNNKVIYLGHNSSVTTTSGWPLSAGDSIDIEVDSTFDSFYAIAESGTQILHWAQVS